MCHGLALIFVTVAYEPLAELDSRRSRDDRHRSGNERRRASSAGALDRVSGAAPIDEPTERLLPAVVDSLREDVPETKRSAGASDG